MTEDKARQVIKRTTGSAIELAICRHGLISDFGDGESLSQEAIDAIKADIVDCLTGDETGCVEPEDLNAENCELIWLMGLDLKMNGIGLIAAERKRQIVVKGYTSDHDDDHISGELAIAAACYACPGDDETLASVTFADGRDHQHNTDGECLLDAYPWPGNDKRGTTPRLERLAIAGALIAAEIDRVIRERDRRSPNDMQ